MDEKKDPKKENPNTIEDITSKDDSIFTIKDDVRLRAFDHQRLFLTSIQSAYDKKMKMFEEYFKRWFGFQVKQNENEPDFKDMYIFVLVNTKLSKVMNMFFSKSDQLVALKPSRKTGIDKVRATETYINKYLYDVACVYEKMREWFLGAYIFRCGFLSVTWKKEWESRAKIDGAKFVKNSVLKYDNVNVEVHDPRDVMYDEGELKTNACYLNDIVVRKFVTPNYIWNNRIRKEKTKSGEEKEIGLYDIGSLSYNDIKGLARASSQVEGKRDFQAVHVGSEQSSTNNLIILTEGYHLFDYFNDGNLVMCIITGMASGNGGASAKEHIIRCHPVVQNLPLGMNNPIVSISMEPLPGQIDGVSEIDLLKTTSDYLKTLMDMMLSNLAQDLTKTVLIPTQTVMPQYKITNSINFVEMEDPSKVKVLDYSNYLSDTLSTVREMQNFLFFTSGTRDYSVANSAGTATEATLASKQSNDRLGANVKMWSNGSVRLMVLLVYNLIKQFDDSKIKEIRVDNEDGSYSFEEITPDHILETYDFSVGTVADSSDDAVMTQQLVNSLQVIMQNPNLKYAKASKIDLDAMIREVLRPFEKYGFKVSEIFPSSDEVNPGLETLLLISGVDVPVTQDDNHEEHMQIHSIAAQTPVIQQILKDNPQALQMLTKHVEAHKAILNPEGQAGNGAIKDAGSGLNNSTTTGQIISSQGGRTQ